MKNSVFIILVCVIIFLVGFLCIHSFRQSKRAEDEYNDKMNELTGKNAPDDEICKSLTEIAERLNSELGNGEDRDIDLYVKGVSDDDINTINNYIDTMNGSIISFSTIEINGEKQDASETRKITFHIERSDTSYAYDYIANNKDIPEDKKEAMELGYKGKGILDEIIKDDMTDYEKELAIHDYIVNNCTYDASAANDKSEYTAYGALVNGRAVCGGYAAAMNLLMKCAGLECRFAVGVAGKTKEETEKHAWNQVKIGNDWYNVDATWDDPIGAEDVLTHMYFNVSDAALSETHTWEEQGHVRCSAMKDNYYYHNGTYVDTNEGLEILSSVKFADPTVTELECAIGPNVSVDNDSLVFLYNYDKVTGANYSVEGNGNYRVLDIKLERY